MQNYDHYIAVDWSMSNMAIARMTKVSNQVRVTEQPTSVKELKIYLNSLKGTKALTVEESNTAQWLYAELHKLVDQFIICDPYRNRLLLEGPKSDPVDASKLVLLLKNELLKPVFHSGDKFIYMRKLVSHYQDLVHAGVKLKNQRSALFRSYGLNHKSEEFKSHDAIEDFVLGHLDEQVDFYNQKKKLYEDKFSELAKLPEAKLLKSIPGIGNIHAIEILSAVVEAKRFPSKGHFLSYSGLMKHEKVSGGRSYGRRSSNFCRELKRVFKMAAFAALREGSENEFSSYYQHLLTKKNYPSHQARHAVARRIACVVYGILKTKTKYEPKVFKDVTI